MSFVPVVPYVPPQPSPRARELGVKLQAAIDEYRRAVPDTTETEIRQALQFAASRNEGAGAALTIGVLIGLVGLLGLAFLVRGGGLQTFPVVAVIGGLVLVLGLAFAAIRARER